jgi:hypothetical protein
MEICMTEEVEQLYHFNDFTETEYRRLVQLARTKWDFISFDDYEKDGAVCLWRHDVDMSPHRALRLAQVESEEGVSSTYFLHLHNSFYNLLEDIVRDKVIGIVKLGHAIGLHFDFRFYEGKITNRTDLEYYLSFERDVLEKTFDVKVSAFSFHNPDVLVEQYLKDDCLASLLNVNNPHIMKHFSYVSDSNGYWRYSRLRDVLEAENGPEKLYVLTHPGWWVPEPMSPKNRVLRCVRGRAESTDKSYDDILAFYGRKNIS